MTLARRLFREIEPLTFEADAEELRRAIRRALRVQPRARPARRAPTVTPAHAASCVWEESGGVACNCSSFQP